MRNFLRDSGMDGKGAHLVSWELVGKPINSGGLEIGNLRIHNKILFALWVWCFSLKSLSLWYKIIVSMGLIPLSGCWLGL